MALLGGNVWQSQRPASESVAVAPVISAIGPVMDCEDWQDQLDFANAACVEARDYAQLQCDTRVAEVRELLESSHIETESRVVEMIFLDQPEEGMGNE